MKTIYTLLLCLSGMTAAAQKVTVHFDFDKYNLDETAKQTLDSLLSSTGFLTQSLRLYGHTDSLGSIAYNEKLSQKRVRAVYDYLFKKGVTAGNLNIKGEGERSPINDNINEESRRLNRRVDIILPGTSENNIPVAVGTNKTLTEKLTDSSLKQGSKIVIPNMNFYGGRHVLLPESVPVLQELLQIMQDNPNLAIEIHGHICCANGAADGLDLDSHTMDLSVNRARTVHNFLIDNGIHRSRLTYKGFGHKYPLVYPEDTEEKRTANRRVEIKIVHK